MTLEILRIRNIASDCETRFGRKTWIGPVYREYCQRFGYVDRNEFNDWLLQANRDDHITLARCDLAGVASADLISDSEIVTKYQTLHFIVDEN